ncbi:MAG TPA: hydrogenase 4 subunit B [Parvularculaceae bacterium]|nr:hydrogenase 4 subunit B [Parvularculaceae bacterium]
MNEAASLLACVAAFFVLAAASVATAKRPRAAAPLYLANAAIAVTAFFISSTALIAAQGPVLFELPVGIPWLGAHFRADALSYFFLSVINFGAAAASLFAIGYGRRESEPQRILPFYPAFLAAMNLVVLADDAFTFLISWEFMSLASFALVLAHHHAPGNRRAAYVYLTMASFGTLALLFVFGLLAGPGGGYLFADIRSRELDAGLSAAVILLALLGAGSKAGLAPVHVWLPLAHPAAPSQVSALMSGVMTKVAVYAFIRIAFDLVGVGDWSIAAPVMLIGGATAVLGILHALMEQDIKRLLAYSTIENIGVIFAMLGFAMAFQANGMAAPAALAFVAALFHVANHSIFKGLLFFGAGSVLNATGVQDIEQMGGLIHRMRKLAPLFLVGCVAISALPPLNGFASEWLAFQAVLQSPDLPQLGLKILAPVIGALLALAAALAAACFVRLYGVSFLGRPRSSSAAKARDPDAWSLGAIALMSALCIFLGVFPGLVVDALGPVATLALGARLTPQSVNQWLTVIPISATQSSYNPLLLFGFIASSGFLAAYISRLAASNAYRRSPSWGCGFGPTGPQTQYTGASFSQPIRNTLGRIAFRACESVDMPLPGEQRPAVITIRLRDLVWDAIYGRIAVVINAISEKLNGLQFLTIRRYLSLVFATLVLLLLGLAAWS